LLLFSSRRSTTKDDGMATKIEPKINWGMTLILSMLEDSYYDKDMFS
jgi:hypothetical protein